MDIKLNRGTGMPQIPLQLPTLLLILGACSALVGLLVLWNEWLLRFMVGGAFLVVGALLLVTGMRAKKMLG